MVEGRIVAVLEKARMDLIIAIVLHKYLIVYILNTSYEFALRDPYSPT